ncbi:hypothetical protein TNCT_395281 [Trichonephila clavata]|uniref:Uncharacterized protein n=1 Tax=Trichonephila clavata TaxID=2740835 RepID=A0A8X6L684_TRICU|nr:hypothetical protein TNCT_395281 [Trichonephila clavata]
MCVRFGDGDLRNGLVFKRRYGSGKIENLELCKMADCSLPSYLPTKPYAKELSEQGVYLSKILHPSSTSLKRNMRRSQGGGVSRVEKSGPLSQMDWVQLVLQTDLPAVMNLPSVTPFFFAGKGSLQAIPENFRFCKHLLNR